MTLPFRDTGSANIRTMSLVQPTKKLQKIYKYKRCTVTMDSWKSHKLAMLVNSTHVYGKLPPTIVQPELQINLPRTQCFQQSLELRLSTYGSRLKLEWVAELF